MKLLIGCPVSSRSWILPSWFFHVEKACEIAGISPEYVFVVGANNEDLDFLSNIPNVHLKVIPESEREDVRIWNTSRYEYMSSLRNALLEKVRELNPDYFLSLDSDILLADNAIASAFDALDQHPEAIAVGLKCYMSVGGTVHPSMGNWINDSYTNYYRVNSDDICTVDIIMAAKLMKPEAYNIDYKWHQNGEDLGWCSSANGIGKKFIWDGRVTNKHVMGKSFLDPVDKRVGF